MGSVEINIGRNWTDDVRYLHELRDVRPSGTSLDLVEIRDIIDIVVDGRNITSNVSEASIFGFFDSLTDALVRLCDGRSRKAIVEFHCEPWEFVVQPTGDDFSISLYGVGRQREVLAHQIGIDQATFLDAVTVAGRSLLRQLYGISESFGSDSFVQSLETKLDRIGTADTVHVDEGVDAVTGSAPRQASTSSATGLTLQYRLEGDFRPVRAYCGEHAFDMHALLVPGRVEAEAGGRSVALSTDYPFLCVLALFDRVRELLGELETGEPGPFVADSSLYHARFDVRVGDQHWDVTLGPPRTSEPSVDMEIPRAECLDTVLTLGEMLVDDLRDLNEHLELNHRLENLARDIRELRTWYEELSGANVYHDSPEAYLEANAHIGPASGEEAAAPEFSRPLGETDRLFPQQAWEFSAPRLYLSGIQTNRRALYVPTAEILQAIAWESGEKLWRASADNETGAISSFRLTPNYLLASKRGGTIAGLDAETGEVDFQARLQGQRDRLLLGAAEFPDLGLVTVAEQRGRIAGISVDHGDVEWAFDPGHGRFAGALFTGPLVGALTREGFFYGLDPTDGDELWKVRLGGLAQLEPLAHQGRLFAFVQDSTNRKTAVHCLKPYTGRTAWRTDVQGQLVGRPEFADQWLFAPVERRGRSLLAGIDAEAADPEVEWTIELDSAGGTPSSTITADIDGEPHGVVQSDRFQITCFSLASGDVRWRVPADEGMWRSRGQPPLIRIGNCLLAVRDDLEIRRLDDGALVHALRQPFHAPEFLAATGELTVVLGESDTPGDIDDRLLGLDLHNFLAEV